MSDLRLTNRIQSPPGGWRYRVEALAERAPHLVWVGPMTTFNDLRTEVHKRCSANGLTPPSDSSLEDQLCQMLPTGYCVDVDGMPTRKAGSFAVMASTFKQGTKTLYSWWKGGMQRVSNDEIVRRSYICNECPENRSIEQCSACAMKGVRALINEIVANTALPTDQLLKACAVCQCSLPAKVRMPLETLLPHIPKDQFARLPSKCWLRDNSSTTASNILT
jgi:hypothetical protein